MNALIKKILAKRQAIRLHIEQMHVTQDALKERRKFHETDTMSWKTADAAVHHLADKIAKAERELTILEKKWSW